MDEFCTWTRLSDSKEFGEMPIHYTIGCLGETARGLYPFYPDVCPHCHRAVSIAPTPTPLEAAFAKEPERSIVDAALRRIGATSAGRAEHG